MKIDRASLMMVRERNLREARAQARSKAGKSSNSKSSNASNILNNKNNASSILGNNTAVSGYTNYTNLKNAAESIQKRAAKLLAEGEDSLFDKAMKTEGVTKEEQEKNRENVVNEVSSFLKDYNSMITSMDKIGGAVNNLYSKQLKNFVTQNKTALSELGITQASDGTLSVDEKMLKAADMSELKKVFGTENGFVQQISARAKTVSTLADAGLASLLNNIYSNNYNSYGSYGNNSAAGTGSWYNTKG